MPARDPNASPHVPSTFPNRPVSPNNSQRPNALSPNASGFSIRTVQSNNGVLSLPSPDHQQSHGYFTQALRRLSGTGGQNLPRMEASASVGQDVPDERNGWDE